MSMTYAALEKTTSESSCTFTEIHAARSPGVSPAFRPAFLSNSLRSGSSRGEISEDLWLLPVPLLRMWLVRTRVRFRVVDSDRDTVIDGV